jgi:hypothetical protein
VDLTDALTLFKRLGVNVPSLSAREFSLAYGLPSDIIPIMAIMPAMS